jgi:serine/threonine-protein kinase
MFADEIQHVPQAAVDASAFRILTVVTDARVQRALQVLWRQHEVIACTDPAAAIELARGRDVDAVLCDQRVPPQLGVDVLRDLRRAHPRALRILLVERPEPRLLLEAVNDVEVFRLVDQPWRIAAMREIPAAALRAARLAPPLGADPLSDEEAERVRRQLAVVVIDNDAVTQQRLRDLMHGTYKLHFAPALDRALQFMEQHETGVLICSTGTGRDELASALKALKHAHPHMSTIAIDPISDYDRVIELINEAQIFRLLRRPFNPALCRPYVDAALARYWYIKSQPQTAWRVATAEPAAPERAPDRLPPALLNRIRGLPGRLHESEARH